MAACSGYLISGMDLSVDRSGEGDVRRGRDCDMRCAFWRRPFFMPLSAVEEVWTEALPARPGRLALRMLASSPKDTGP
jgi:hypothetical protein